MSKQNFAPMAELCYCYSLHAAKARENSLSWLFLIRHQTCMQIWMIDDAVDGCSTDMDEIQNALSFINADAKH